MTKEEKFLQKLRNSKKTFPWRDLCSLLSSLGYEKKEMAGSRVRFYNKSLSSLLLLHKPHPENEIKGGALKSVKSKLTEDGFL